MGWDINYSNLTKKDCVKELLASMARSNWQVFDHASTTQGAYFAVKVPSGEEFIYCAIIERRGKYFATKTMDEGMGPVINDCPLRLLDRVKGPGTQWANDWRDSVRAHHARRKAGNDLVKSIRPGMTVGLYKNHYTVIENNGTNLIVVKDGQRYKISKRQFKSLSIEA